MKNLENHVVYEEREIYFGKITEQKTVKRISVDQLSVTIHYTDNTFMEITHDQVDGFELWIPK